MVGLSKEGKSIVNLGIVNEVVGDGRNEGAMLPSLSQTGTASPASQRRITPKPDRADAMEAFVLTAVVVLEGLLEEVEGRVESGGGALLCCLVLGTVVHLEPLVGLFLWSHGARTGVVAKESQGAGPKQTILQA